MTISKLTNYVLVVAILLAAYYALKLDLSFAGLSPLKATGVLILLFGGLLTECMITLLLVRIFYPLQSLRFVAYFVVLLYVGINLLQVISFGISSDFVTKLAMGNVEFVGLLVTFENVLIVGLAMLGLLLVPVLIIRHLPGNQRQKSEQGVTTYPLGNAMVFALSTILLGVLLNNARYWMPEAVVDMRSTLLRANFLQRLKPVDQFFRLFKNKPVSELFPELSAQDVVELGKYGFVLNQDKRFPLLKEKIYQSPLPFVREQMQKPNVIVIFTEGFSARTSSVYSGENVGITPNLEDFSRRSMVVDNYYNHTAATYRGLHGGLCSLFPKYGALGGWLDSFEDIPKTNYKCLSDIFRNNGYRSYYFDPHFEDTSGLDEMMKQLKFDEVLNADQLLPDYLNNEQSIHTGWLSDHQMYRSLVGFLQQQQQVVEVDQNNKKPFFLTLYSVETHAWVDVSDDGISFGKGKRNVLNTIHNMDDAFGYFWKYYQNSRYAENTLIVFTSDHSHYYSNPYLKLMKAVGADNYQKLFIGKIPMIIHDPLADLPPEYDARYASSIDFAPTLVHLLGLPNEKNAFLGSSIFDKGAKAYEDRGVAAYGENTYLINQEKIHTEQQSEQYHAQLDLLSRYIRYVQGLEIKNRIYP